MALYTDTNLFLSVIYVYTAISRLLLCKHFRQGLIMYSMFVWRVLFSWYVQSFRNNPIGLTKLYTVCEEQSWYCHLFINLMKVVFVSLYEKIVRFSGYNILLVILRLLLLSVMIQLWQFIAKSRWYTNKIRRQILLNMKLTAVWQLFTPDNNSGNNKNLWKVTNFLQYV